MATLEKIRKKSVLLLVIIGTALIAFIIGDFLNSGRSIFGSGTTVAKVDGEKIDYLQFQQRYGAVAENNQQSNQQDAAIMQNQVLEEMIGEVLMDEEYDALGIEVSGKELSEYMFKHLIRRDQNFAQGLNYFAQGLQAPVELKDPAKPEQLVQDFHTFIFNPSKFGRQEDEGIAQAKAWWMGYEQTAENQLKEAKFGRLLMGAVAANDLDRAALKESLSNSYEVQMVAVPYASLDDKDYAVTDDEVKAVYEKEKERFAMKEEIRKAHYIVVPIVPSADDNAKADKFMATVDSTLHATAGIEGVRSFSELSIAEKESRLSDLGREVALKNFVDSAAVGEISKINRVGDNRVIYRLLGKKQEADTVTVTMASVLGNKVMQDSVLAQLNGGKTLDELANDSTVVKGAENQKLDLVAALAAGQISQEVKDQILSADGNFFVLQSGNDGAALCKVLSKGEVKTIYKTATITYTVTASKETRASLLADFQSYIDKNNTAAAFADNGAKAEQSYAVQEAVLTAESPVLGMQYNYVKSSAKLIQWLFKEAKEGAVSAIQTDNDKYVAVALDKVYDGAYWPLSDPMVKDECEVIARNEKKGADMVKKYAGKAKDIDGYAAAMGKTVQTLRVGGGNPTIEPALGGQVPYAALNKAYGPVAGKTMAFVYAVVKKDIAANEVPDAQADGSYRQQFMMFNNVVDILKNNKEVENNIINFR